MRSLLDTIQARIEESHEISRYVVGLLIFLGLLGTFWGLLATVNSVGETIGGLSAGTGDVVTLFENLKGGLQAPLSGMGTAFSRSEEHTSELQSLMRISYAVFCLKKKNEEKQE